MDDPSGFALRLEQALKTRKVGKMYALAVELGINESALSRWRRGKPISVGNLVRLSRHLCVSIDWLLTGAGSMSIECGDIPEAWQSEIIADLAAIDPPAREHLAELMRHLAGARRSGCFEPASRAARAPDATDGGCPPQGIEL